MDDIYVILADLYQIVRGKSKSPERQARETATKIAALDRTLARALGRRGAGLQLKPMIDAVNQLDEFDGADLGKIKKAIKALESFQRKFEPLFWDA